MEKLTFKPSDFVLSGGDFSAKSEKLAAYCNDRFDKWLESQPTVYGNKCGNWYENSPSISSSLSQKAKLVCIEPLEKCTHPKEKVKWHDYFKFIGEDRGDKSSFLCQCGAEVVPCAFEVKA